MLVNALNDRLLDKGCKLTVRMAENKNLAQKTANVLSRIILEDGEYGPGQKLPNENALAERFGISRTTLREAIKTLSAGGILEVRHGRGTFVAEQLPKRSDPSLPELMRMKIELKDLVEVRMIIEPQVAALACTRATDKEIAYISELELEVERLLKMGEDTTDADIAFHTAILRAAHNVFFLHIEPVVRRCLSDQRTLKANESLKKSLLPDHTMIVEFLQKRDVESGESAVHIHLHRLMDRLD